MTTLSMTIALDLQNTSPARFFAGLVTSIPEARAELGAIDAGARWDQEDVRRCRDGEEDAYRRLIERHQARISAMMWRFSRDPVVHDELVQDVFVEAYGSLAGFRGRAPFEHWLARIATRVGYRYWKRQARTRAHPTVSIEEWDGVMDEAPDDLEPAEAAEQLHALLAALPARDRLVLTLRYVEDHSVLETARLTGWSASMVKVQTLRARKKLKALFEDARREKAS